MIRMPQIEGIVKIKCYFIIFLFYVPCFRVKVKESALPLFCNTHKHTCEWVCVYTLSHQYKHNSVGLIHWFLSIYTSLQHINITALFNLFLMLLMFCQIETLEDFEKVSTSAERQSFIEKLDQV